MQSGVLETGQAFGLDLKETTIPQALRQAAALVGDIGGAATRPPFPPSTDAAKAAAPPAPPKPTPPTPTPPPCPPNPRTAGSWATHAIGKWHLGYYQWAYTPTFRGFDSYLGYLTGGESYFTHMSADFYDIR